MSIKLVWGRKRRAEPPRRAVAARRMWRMIDYVNLPTHLKYSLFFAGENIALSETKYFY